jgi:putative hydrolase of the HAD superfamily
LNIIFDLGGVVFRWEPEKLIADTIKDKDLHAIVRSEILNHHDWIELDRGTLTEEAAILRGCERTGLPLSEISRLIKAVPPFLVPIDASVNLIDELKSFKNKLFVLSNMHIASINYLESNYSILDKFDGRVISCRIHKVKPEPDIYHHLIETYHLDINESVFIDDTSVNLDTAADLGLKTIQFENPAQCREELLKMGCLE